MNNYIEKWNYTDVTTRIKALRKKGNHSLTWACMKLQELDYITSESTLCKYENGRITIPLEFIVICCRLYGCSVEYLLFGKENNPPLHWILDSFSLHCHSRIMEGKKKMPFSYIEIFHRIYELSLNQASMQSKFHGLRKEVKYICCQSSG